MRTCFLFAIIVLLASCEKDVERVVYPVGWTGTATEKVDDRLSVLYNYSKGERSNNAELSKHLSDSEKRYKWGDIDKNDRMKLKGAFKRYVDTECEKCFFKPEILILNKYEFLRFRHFKKTVLLVKINGEWFDEKGRTVIGPALARPILGKYKISSNFGVRMHPLLHSRRIHEGCDYAAPVGAKVVAIRRGRILRTYHSKRSGLTIEIAHGEGRKSVYRHLSKKFVKKGRNVELGEVIAEVGESGAATGPHLHFEYLLDGVSVPWTQENLTGLPATLNMRMKVRSAFDDLGARLYWNDERR